VIPNPASAIKFVQAFLPRLPSHGDWMEAAQKTTLGLRGMSVREKFLFLNSGMQMGVKTDDDRKHAARALQIDTI
jgi:hypothetical protein